MLPVRLQLGNLCARLQAIQGRRVDGLPVHCLLLTFFLALFELLLRLHVFIILLAVLVIVDRDIFQFFFVGVLGLLPERRLTKIIRNLDLFLLIHFFCGRLPVRICTTLKLC